MRVAFFTDTYLPHANGVAVSVEYQRRALKELGIEVYLFAPSENGYDDKQNDVFRLPSIKAWPTLPESIKLPLLFPYKNYSKVFSLDYDLVHAHGNGLFSLLGLVAARTKKIPYILSFHTMLGKYTHYFFNGKLVKEPLINRFIKKYGNLCEAVVVPSAKMKDELLKNGIVKEIRVIPNFIELHKFRGNKKGYLRKVCKISKDKPILLSVGRLNIEKNFEFLIRAFKIVCKSYPDVHLVIVGEGQGLVLLKKLTKLLQINKNVHFPGKIETLNMPLVYSDAEMFVFASDTETQGMVVLEAAASGLPMVLYKDKAFSDIAQDNVNAYLVPMNEEIFAKKVEELIKDQGLRKKFSEQSLEIANKNFNEEVILDKLTKLYKNLIENHR